MPKTIDIRPATELDISWIMDDLRDFSKFFATNKPLFGDPDFVRLGVANLIKNHFFVVATHSASPAGFIAGLITPHMLNPEIDVLAELFWWVKPAFRGSRVGLKLLNEFVAWGKANVDWITFTLESHSPVNGDALIKRGFHLHERNFLMEV